MREQKLTILVIDDMEINRVMLRNLLEDTYDVLEADNGNKALLLMEDKSVDLILLDLVMPEMDGFTFLQKVKEQFNFAQIPVVVITARTDVESEIQTVALGADDFIRKPYQLDMVKKKVGNVIRKYVAPTKELKHHLEESNERLKYLMELMEGGVAILEYGEYPVCTFHNQLICQLTGYTPEEFHEKFSHDVSQLVYKEDRDSLLSKMSEDKTKQDISHFAIRLVAKDKSLVWVGFTATRQEIDFHTTRFYLMFRKLSEPGDEQERNSNYLNELLNRIERDWLTGLYNRKSFYDRTQNLLQQNPGTEYTLGMIDFDCFKMINELYGIQRGDHTLIRLSKLLERVCQGRGICGRLETDHFAFCLPTKVLDENQQMVDRFLKNGMKVKETNYVASMHLGLYRIVDPTISVDSMCDRATLALNQIKDQFMVRCIYFSQELQNKLVDEQEMIHDMEASLNNGEFYVEYQPIMDVSTGKIAYAEALVRWNHPKKGKISPGTFIPLFENNGFITKLDFFVLEQVCRFLQEEQEKGNFIPPVTVNISRINFYKPELLIEIEQLLQRYHLTNKNIKFEITETAYMDNNGQLLQVTDHFEKMGYELVMDDFGSGYSSLNLLKDIPVSILKLDMKFVTEMEQSEKAYNMLYSVIRMAENLKLHVVAEGVETQKQLDLLAGMGCDFVQGFYLCRPISRDEFVTSWKMKETPKVSQLEKDAILVVEGQESDRAQLKSLLEPKYKVLEAQNGEEALDVIRLHIGELRLLITDIQMPVMDGYELVQKVSKDPVMRDIPSLMISTCEDDRSEDAAIANGALDILQKPFRVESFTKKIENVIRISGRFSEYKMRKN